jgi:hypothetical protein
MSLLVLQYDLRAAERARERLQGSEISGRPVSLQRLVGKGQQLRICGYYPNLLD